MESVLAPKDLIANDGMLVTSTQEMIWWTQNATTVGKP